MRIILFSWEYPPRIIGKLAEYVNALATQLAKKQIEAHVVTYHESLTGAVEETNGAKTVRVANPVRRFNMGFNPEPRSGASRSEHLLPSKQTGQPHRRFRLAFHSSSGNFEKRAWNTVCLLR